MNELLLVNERLTETKRVLLNLEDNSEKIDFDVEEGQIAVLHIDPYTLFLEASDTEFTYVNVETIHSQVKFNSDHIGDFFEHFKNVDSPYAELVSSELLKSFFNSHPVGGGLLNFAYALDLLSVYSVLAEKNYSSSMLTAYNTASMLTVYGAYTNSIIGESKFNIVWYSSFATMFNPELMSIVEAIQGIEKELSGPVLSTSDYRLYPVEDLQKRVRKISDKLYTYKEYIFKTVKKQNKRIDGVVLQHVACGDEVIVQLLTDDLKIYVVKLDKDFKFTCVLDEICTTTEKIIKANDLFKTIEKSLFQIHEKVDYEYYYKEATPAKSRGLRATKAASTDGQCAPKFLVNIINNWVTTEDNTVNKPISITLEFNEVAVIDNDGITAPTGYKTPLFSKIENNVLNLISTLSQEIDTVGSLVLPSLVELHDIKLDNDHITDSLGDLSLSDLLNVFTTLQVVSNLRKENKVEGEDGQSMSDTILNSQTIQDDLVVLDVALAVTKVKFDNNFRKLPYSMELLNTINLCMIRGLFKNDYCGVVGEILRNGFPSGKDFKASFIHFIR